MVFLFQGRCNNILLKADRNLILSLPWRIEYVT